MTLRYIDGLEDLMPWIVITPPTIVVGRNGNCMQMAAGNRVQYVPVSGWASPTVTIGFAFRPTAFPTMGSTSYMLVLWDDVNNTFQTNICFGGSGQIAAYRATTQLGISAAGALVLNQWQYVEVQITVSATVGTVVVRVNGTVVLNLSGQNTKGSTVSGNIGTVEFNSPISSISYDDFYLMTGAGDSFQGDVRVETLYPNGNGNTNAWTNSAGNSTNNWSYVDENPVDTSDYVAGATTGLVDLYAMTDLSTTAQAILAVQPTIWAAKTDGTARQVQFVTRRTINTVGPSQALDNISAFNVVNVLTTDPETGVAWTPTNVNALQVGVQVV